ncbi:MAG: cobyrinic acid a,c-diamide synthase, partial [Pseudobutyrivibrio sp.]|nr:cobyrinic acid a,c-diamide synthase [Pseudobutyrivibrio sp.]
KINSYLKEVIASLAEHFDYIVIDGEAGIEQINRRVMEKVTHLVMITDSSKKGCDVIKTIKSVADNLVMYEKLGAIVNRVPDESVLQYMDLGEIPLLSFIPSDAALTKRDLTGESVFFMPGDSPLVIGCKKALENLEII